MHRSGAWGGGFLSTPFYIAVAVVLLRCPFIGCNLSADTITADANGDAIAVKCMACTYVKNNTYYKTNSDGDVMVTFPCTKSFVENQFCGTPTEDVLAMVTPEPVQLCQATQYKKTCRLDTSETVTVWGDERSDPSYVSVRQSVIGNATFNALIAGYGRDFTATDFKLLAHRGKFTPEDPRELDMGYPDIYAYYKHSPALALMGKTNFPLPNASFEYPSHFTYKFMPTFNNHNSKLLYYTGYNDGSYGRLTTHIACDKYSYATNLYDSAEIRCFYAALFDYLSSHGNVDMVETESTLVTNLFFHGYSTSEISGYETTYNTSTNCSPNCFVNMTVANGQVQLTGRGTGDVRSNGSAITDFHSAFLPGFTIGAGSGSSTMLRYYTSFMKNGMHIPYPLMLFEIDGYGNTRGRSRIQLFEESVDGTNWTMHPQSAAPALVNAYNAADWTEFWRIINNDVYMFYSQSWWNPTSRLIGPTGNNKYFRIVTLVGFGTYAPHRHSTSFNFFTFVPGYMLVAQQKQTINLFVTPTLHPTTANVSSTLGLDYCTRIPSCTYIPSPYSTYPVDNTSAIAVAANVTDTGSTIMRNFMTTSVMPLLYKSCKVAVDPINKFLKSPYMLQNKTCYRYGEDPAKLTCYTTTAVNHTGPTVVLTDMAQKTLEYRKNNYAMKVSTEFQNPGYPIPIAVLGPPFTPTNTTPIAWIYTQPVSNSMKVPDEEIYVTTVETCSFDWDKTGILDMTMDATCNCIDYPITAGKCLCRDLRSYKNIPEMSAGVTFSYPHFFTPFPFPTDYDVISSRMSFDYNFYTTVNIDCVDFLCGDNQECIMKLSTSPYLTACNNQKKILTATLKSLMGITTAVHESVKVFLMKTIVANTANLTAIPPIDNVPATATATMRGDMKKFANSLAMYYNNIRNAKPMMNPDVMYRSLTAYGGYTYNPQFTGIGSNVVGVSTLFADDISILAQKNNTMMVTPQGLVGYFSDKLTDLAAKVQTGFEMSHNEAQYMSYSHNIILNEINGNSATQNDEDNAAMASMSATQGTNYIDMMIGARMATLNSQGSALMVKTLDQISKGRDFKNKIDACSSNTAASAATCVGSVTGILLGTSVKTTGSIVTLDNIVLRPISNNYVYSTPEFCYNGMHYTVTSPDLLFIFHNNTMKVSTKLYWDPESITTVNTRILPECDNPNLVITDVYPSIRIVGPDATTDTPLFVAADHLNSTTAILHGSGNLANVTGMLNNVSRSLMDMTARLGTMDRNIDNVSKQVTNLTTEVNSMDEFDLQAHKKDIQDLIATDSENIASLGVAASAMVISLISIGLSVYYVCGKKGSSRYVI